MQDSSHWTTHHRLQSATAVRTQRSKFQSKSDNHFRRKQVIKEAELEAYTWSSLSNRCMMNSQLNPQCTAHSHTDSQCIEQRIKHKVSVNLQSGSKVTASSVTVKVSNKWGHTDHQLTFLCRLIYYFNFNTYNVRTVTATLFLLHTPYTHHYHVFSAQQSIASHLILNSLILFWKFTISDKSNLVN